jgi:hypothetical protein
MDHSVYYIIQIFQDIIKYFHYRIIALLLFFYENKDQNK